MLGWVGTDCAQHTPPVLFFFFPSVSFKQVLHFLLNVSQEATKIERRDEYRIARHPRIGLSHFR